MIAMLLILLTAALVHAESPRPIGLRELPLLFADDSGVARKDACKDVSEAKTQSAKMPGR